MLQHIRPFCFWAQHLDAINQERLPDFLHANRSTVEGIVQTCQRQRKHWDRDAQELLRNESELLLQSFRNTQPTSGRESVERRLDAIIQTQATEIMELPGLALSFKVFLVNQLERVNRQTGAYVAWARKIDALLCSTPEAQVYELASGGGGFCRHLLKSHDKAHALRVTGSDYDQDFVDLAQAKCRANDSQLRFENRDATQLWDIHDVDLFVCAQAAHHMNAGDIVAMIHTALRAKQGILIIDLLRSLTGALEAACAVALLSPLTPVFWDGFQSVRRGFLPSELTLLATLAGAQNIVTEPLGPVHFSLHAKGQAEAAF
ncbi:MAG: methyltransferase domain-containing protein [Myxococcales bacterium]|nr:MAG: methyltransferase domain-containing protein [Myxococcales bacterium]